MELNQEIWIEISKWLGPADLLQLRLCCRSLCQKITSRAIWRPRCYDNWLSYQVHDVWNIETVPLDQSWFQYFCSRQRLERKMLADVISQHREYHQFFPEFGQRYNAGHAAAWLRRVVERGFLHSGLRFDTVTLCHHLLTSLRHRHVYELFAPSSSEYVHDAEQTVFLRLAAMDGSFDLLLPHRQRVLNGVHTLVKQEHGLDGFLAMPATLRVDRLVCFLMGLLAPQRQQQQHQQQLCLEDFMLLRVYAGETQGHPLLVLSIVQTLAAYYGVETVLCGSYLVIRDTQLRAGETYLTVSSRGVPKIFTRRRLVQSLRRILGGSTEQTITNQVLPSILQPLARAELVSTVFRELLPLHSRSRWTNASPKNVETLRRLFPISRQPMSAEIVHYFTCVYKAAEIQSRIEMRISSLYAVAFKEVFRLVSRQYPGDYCYAAKLLHSRGVDFGEHVLPYEEWLFQLHSIALEESDQLGKFVTSSRDQQPLCIIGVRTFQNGNTYYTLMNFCGEFFVELSDNLQPFDAQDERDKINEFLGCSGLSDLGLVFSHMDEENGRLVLNEKVQQLIYGQCSGSAV
ncbi:ZYBA0S07-01398g1_1 [Zygosaccharomyces bailii CLIB 213]|uniref:ZYBA0S07-01398g1_1 n=1 Tax=Zygosaccharomyces bailii (strain CLIB 213 / ATCC 58445 / CBS 680 / BCRC 21525 / NBRC 1098 / NCYC 1416 / NRRL Y-2227) TaxID=1333698 RepID=A0A8J2T8R7_ZYGB2|nr:ZYBA0S07-01398g1_1 [Zygosaccharomyces bailii CLIB 213]